MAKPSWLTVSPMSGSGNKTLSNSASAHTGRVERTGTVTITADGASSPKTYKVTQSPKAEFASFNDGEDMAVQKSGGTVNVKGKTNSSKLTFAWKGNVNDVTLPESYTANGKPSTNGSSISGDPGASAEFEFSISLSIPVNGTVNEVNRVLQVTTNDSQVTEITLKQAAGDATLSVTPTEITLDQSGSAKTVEVKSNTIWTVS